MVNLGATTVAGTLNYIGSGEVTAKVFNLSGTTGVNAVLLANQSVAVPLTLTSNFAATGAGAKTLVLGGGSPASAANLIQGVIQDSTAATSLTKIGSGTWLYSPAVTNYAGASTGITVTTGAANQNQLTLNSVAGLVLGQVVTTAPTNLSAGVVITAIDTVNNRITVSGNVGGTAITGGSAITFGAIGTGFTGAVTIAGGTMQFQPTAGSGVGSDLINATTGSIAFGTDTLTNNGFAGGTLEYIGRSTTTLTETTGALIATAGLGIVKLTAGGGTPTLSLASHTIANHAVGATLNFRPTTVGGIQFAVAPTAVLNGAMTNAYITNPTTGAIDFVATPTANTNIAALAVPTGNLPTTGGAAAGNYLLSTTINPTTGALAANTIRITSGASLTLGNTLTISSTAAGTSGGILHDNAGARRRSAARSISTFRPLTRN